MITTVIVVVCAYVFLWTGALIADKARQGNQIRKAKAQQSKIDALSPQDKAIRNAGIYLKTNLSTLDPFERLILDFLQRKYGLDEALGAAVNPIDLKSNPATYPNEIDYVARVAYPDKVVTTPPPLSLKGPSLTNAYSSNCDQFALPSSYWQAMQNNYTAGGYSMAHIALALTFMKDNQCTIPSDQANLQDKARDGMVALAGDKATVSDLRYESIAFLMIIGGYDHVEPDWIQQIIAEQRSNGSWSEKVGDNKESSHATVLAVWALLEYQNPNKPYEPLIHRPSIR